MLTNMCSPSAEVNFFDDNRNALKRAIVEDYNRNLGCIDKGDGMANRYTISHRSWKWTKKKYMSLAGPNSSQQLHFSSSCDKNRLSQRISPVFGKGHANNIWVEREPCMRKIHGRAVNVATHFGRFDASDSKHWLVPSNQSFYCVCSTYIIEHKLSMKCEKCEVGLYVDTKCFLDCHMKSEL
jgi:hypothetical protein